MASGKHDKHDETVVKKVSKKHDDHGHGGAWKVAFADFCLALLCLFLVMWLLASRNQEAAEAALRAATGGSPMNEGQGIMPETMGGPRGSLISREPLPRDPAAQAHSNDTQPGQQKTRYESPEDLAELAKILKDMSEDAGLSNNLRTVITPYGLRVMLHDTDRQGMFERGSSTPNEKFRILLRNMGPLFAGIENQMLLVGHTDSVQYAVREQGGVFSNWALSSNRAMSARAQLMIGGMPTSSILQVVGMADRAPLDAQNPKAALNRRIEMLILTTAQSQTMSAMFGMPSRTTPLTEGVQTVVPDAGQLGALRSQLHPDAAAAEKSP